ncbi:MAG: MaoC family dehydratase [Pseudomonadota bacterium]
MTTVAQKPYFFDDLEVGMEASMSRVVTEADIYAFADISGDLNPVHIDEAYASQTIFKQRVAHGILTAGYISAVFGMHLPGPGAIYITQTLNFKAPVCIGDLVRARVVIHDLVPAKRRALFDCYCTVNNKIVLDGEAMLMVPAKPKDG